MNVKGLGQVFTPRYIVDFILKISNYSGEAILDKTILEPSAGDGNFTNVIITKIFEEANSKLIPDKEIKRIIKKSVFAIEIDKSKYDILIKNTVSLINSKLKTKRDYIDSEFLKDNFILGDSLKYDWKIKFDFIVGNPPYIRLHNLDKSYLEFLRNEFTSMKIGSVDLYFAFFDKYVDYLTDNGSLCYITPNNFLISNSATRLRDKIFSKIHQVYDFQSEKIFKNASTYNSILLMKSKPSKNIKAYLPKIINSRIFKENAKDVKLIGNRIVIPKSNNSFEILEADKPKLNFKNGLATLSDDLFISTNVYKIDEHKWSFNGFEIETEFIKPIVKISLMNDSKVRYAIFPYKIVDNKVIQLEENKLNKYPLLNKYLQHYKSDLENRSLDKNSNWYSYGRSQSLNSILVDKVVIKTLIKDKLEYKYVRKGTLVYSGLYSEYLNKSKVNQFLNDEKLKNFLCSLGSDKSGGYKMINSTTFSEVYNEKRNS